MKKFFLITTTFIIHSCSCLCQGQLTTGPQPLTWDMNKYFFFRGSYPNNGKPSWGDWKWAANGIAHNKDYIFICSIERTILGTTGKTDYVIWKIPITYKLDRDYWNDPSVQRFQLTKMNTSGSTTRKTFKKYTHIGDIDVCTIAGTEYIVAPLTGGGHPIIGLFRTSDLSFVNFHYLLPLQDVGWCAFSNKDNRLYVSNDYNRFFYAFKIDAMKINSSLHNALVIKITGTLAQREPKIYSIKKPIANMQGGCFTPDGKLLYVSSGLPQKNNITDGITVFETRNWTVINHSINRTRDPRTKGCFEFNFDTGEWYNPWGEEPEGLDIFDADDGRTPYVRGQLHVLLDDHNAYKSNDVSIKHYGIFKAPADIVVPAISSHGTSRNHPAIAAILNQCSDVKNNASALFRCGTTTVKFTYKKGYPETILGYTKITVKNKHDDCTTALQLFSCDDVVSDNYCAPSGTWFYIDPPSLPFTIETTQAQGGLSYTAMHVYSGNCGDLREIASDVSNGTSHHAKITFDPPPGAGRLYIKITSYSVNHYGSFGMRVRKIAPGQSLFTSSSFIAGDKEYVHKNPALPIDVNGDKKTDLVFIGQNWSPQGENLNIRTKISNGDGTYTGYSCIMNDDFTIHYYPTLTGDIDNDQKTDIIFTTQGASPRDLVIKVKRSNGDGTFTSLQQTFANESPSLHPAYPAKTGDFDGDGRTDIIFFGFNWYGPGLNVRIKCSNGDGTFRSYAQVLGDKADVLKYPVIVADVTGDQKSDLVFVGQDWNGSGLNIRTKISNGDGTFTAVETRHGDGSGVHKYPTLVGDVDGDGKADLVFVGSGWSDPGLNIRTKLSNGDGTYRKKSEVIGDGSGVLDYPVLTGDADGDGKMDIIFTGQNWTGCGLNIRVKLSKGDGTWCSRWQTLGDGKRVHTYPVLVGTFNSDNKTDLVFVGQKWEGEGLNIKTKFSIATGCESIDRVYENDTVTIEDPVITGRTINTLDISDIEDTLTSLPAAGINKVMATLPADRSRKQYGVFPNPANSVLTITSTTTGPLSLRIMNSNGDILIRMEKIFNGQKIDIRSLAAGVYLVEINDHVSAGRKLIKIIKVN